MNRALLVSSPMLMLTLTAGYVPSSPDLGVAEGRCRPGESGPAFLVNIAGLKDRRGELKLELYPSTDADFLTDDNKLIMAGKPFRRVRAPVSSEGRVTLCIRAPGPGPWSLSLLHDRDGNRKFGLSTDGVGFAGNPKLRASKPKAAAARAVAGPGVTPVTIVLNYRKGLLAFGPLGS